MRGERGRSERVRGARPGKPGRQTAAASRRTPHERRVGVVSLQISRPLRIGVGGEEEALAGDLEFAVEVDAREDVGGFLVFVGEA
jgi:hypothetical protein